MYLHLSSFSDLVDVTRWVGARCFISYYAVIQYHAIHWRSQQLRKLLRLLSETRKHLEQWWPNRGGWVTQGRTNGHGKDYTPRPAFACSHHRVLVHVSCYSWALYNSCLFCTYFFSWSCVISCRVCMGLRLNISNMPPQRETFKLFEKIDTIFKIFDFGCSSNLCLPARGWPRRLANCPVSSMPWSAKSCVMPVKLPPRCPGSTWDAKTFRTTQLL